MLNLEQIVKATFSGKLTAVIVIFKNKKDAKQSIYIV